MSGRGSVMPYSSSLHLTGSDHSLKALFLLVTPFFSFLQANSADNGSADTVVGKITALHFSSLSPVPLQSSGMKRGRDDVLRERTGEQRV